MKKELLEQLIAENQQTVRDAKLSPRLTQALCSLARQCGDDHDFEDTIADILIMHGNDTDDEEMIQIGIDYNEFKDLEPLAQRVDLMEVLR